MNGTIAIWFLAESVIGRGLRHADRFVDDHQQLERDPGILERLGHQHAA
jgi:hypothetical protein